VTIAKKKNGYKEENIVGFDADIREKVKDSGVIRRNDLIW
jgi:hypothetical protein